MKQRMTVILAALLLASSVYTAVFADEPVPQQSAEATGQTAEAVSGQTEAPSEQTEAPTEQNGTEAEPKERTYNRFQKGFFPTSTDASYELLQQTIDLYVSKHLYEFDRSEVLDKFLYDLIETHPELFEMYMNTVLGTMDPYSSFHTADSGFLSIKSDNAGFGITISDADGAVTVLSVQPGSTADTAGIRPGDRIVGVLGRDVRKLPWDAVAYFVKYPYMFLGEPDEKGRYADYNPIIDISIERGSEVITFNLQKGVVYDAELVSEYDEEKGIAYIGINSFLGETLADDFEAVLQKFAEMGVMKYTIDLRGNGGGSLEYAIAMVQHFVPEGETMCFINDRNMDEPQPYISKAGFKVPYKTISVMTDENTASAAELMASILRNKAGAKLFGKKTFGKALGQNSFGISTGDFVTITTFEILDANGESYNGIGLYPDLETEDVERIIEFPTGLAVFNHWNYQGIEDGAYHEPCYAYEQRLELLGLIRTEDVDGIWTNETTLATQVFQVRYKCGTDGFLNDTTVTTLTNVINGLKDRTYIEDSTRDIADIAHSSFSQAKRLKAEKETLAKKEKKRIEENRAFLEVWFDENT